MREKKPINFQEQQKTQNYNTARKKTHLSEISVVRYWHFVLYGTNRKH